MMSRVTARMLRFFIIDDQKIEIDEDIPVTVLRSETDAPDRDDPDVPTINGWEVHCEHAYNHSGLQFDALSIDVFFDNDDEQSDDPQHRLDEDSPRLIPAGLSHGLAALAQRKPDDGYGNVYPLAWEIRTASPKEIYNLPNAMRGEIIRNYGLLLAIANSPSKGMGKGFLGLEDDPKIRRNKIDIVEASFANQTETYGGGGDMIQRLLPKWRERFLANVQNKTIQIDVDDLRLLPQRVSTWISKGSSLISAHDLSIAILGRGNEEVDRISLASIFADLDPKTLLDFQQSVFTWIDELIASHGDDLIKYVDEATRIVRHIAEHLRSLNHSENSPPDNYASVYKVWGGKKFPYVAKCLALVSYCVISSIFYNANVKEYKNKFPVPKKYEDINGALIKNTKPNPQVLRRPFLDSMPSGHVRLKNISQFDKQVLTILKNPDLEWPFSKTFLTALCCVLEEVLPKHRVNERGNNDFDVNNFYVAKDQTNHKFYIGKLLSDECPSLFSTWKGLDED